MTLAPDRAAHPLGSKPRRQPVDQPRQLELARGLAEQRVLGRVERLAPARGQRETVEAETGIEARDLVGEQPDDVRRIARRKRRFRLGLADLTIDPEAVESDPPRAEPPPSQ